MGNTRQKYEAVIGLEVHARISSAGKAFCSCPNDISPEPNTFTCPVCLGHPGALPVLNLKLVEAAILAGLALNCKINKESSFARKNYFYHDLPKGYQITQYEEPVCSGGWLDIDGQKILINRIHIEEDSGKTVYTDDGLLLIDMNRAGTPLIEIVTEPDINDPALAAGFLKELRLILIYLGICSGDMEKGVFRCDANISLRDDVKSYPRTEIKNLNSFRHLEKSLNYEIERQEQILGNGGTITTETMTWDENLGRTRAMRDKEIEGEYRYFPEPDLGALRIDDEMINKFRAEIPELPGQLRERLRKEYGLERELPDIIAREREMADLFEKACSELENANHLAFRRIGNWLVNEISGIMTERKCALSDLRIHGSDLARISDLQEEERISGKIATFLIRHIIENGGEPEEIISENNWEMISDRKLIKGILTNLINENPDKAKEYRKGKLKAFRFFTGSVMNETGGLANPRIMKEELERLLRKH